MNDTLSRDSRSHRHGLGELLVERIGKPPHVTTGGCEIRGEAAADARMRDQHTVGMSREHPVPGVDMARDSGLNVHVEPVEAVELDRATVPRRVLVVSHEELDVELIEELEATP